MAYDLAYRRNINVGFSRGDSPSPTRLAEGIQGLVAAAVVLLPQVVTSSRMERERELLRDDLASQTREMPKITTADLMRELSHE